MIYTIELEFKKDLPAYPKEARLYKHNSKGVDVDYMIKKSLDSVFKIIDPELCKNSEKELNWLIDLINKENSVEFQILDLDLRGLFLTFKNSLKQEFNNTLKNIDIQTIGDYIDTCKKYSYMIDEQKAKKLTINNICLVFKLDHPIHQSLNCLNTIAIFCDLNPYEQNKTYSLVIKRVELLEINKSLWNNKQIKININSNTSYYDPEFCYDLQQITPIISFGKKDSELRKYLRYDDWTSFIYAIHKYYDEKKNNANTDNQIIYFLSKSTKYDANDQVSCYLLQLKGKANIVMNPSAKYYLINRDDENNSYHINIKDIKNNFQDDLLKKLTNEKDNTNKSNDALQDKNKNYNDSINSLMPQKQELLQIKEEQEKILEQIKSDLNNLNNELSLLKENLNFIKDEQKSLQNDRKNIIKNEDLKEEELEKYLIINQKQLNLNSEQQKDIEEKIQKKQKTISEFKKQLDDKNNEKELNDKSLQEINFKIDGYSQKIEENLKNIDENDLAIKRYEKQIDFINQKQYNISYLTFSFDDEQNNIFTPLQLFNSSEYDDIKTINNFYINEKDNGTLAILNRYVDGLDQIRFGYYKNPYLFENLIDPLNLKVDGKEQLKEEIINKYQLNDNQQSAVFKAINIDNFFYLQGPPGTGKTQTICAIANEYALENKTILMTSQSHEAINNFFDRLDELNNDNPLFIMIKYIANEEKDKENKYNLDCAWKRFISKCINACEKPNNNKECIEIIKELQENNFIQPNFLTNSEIVIINNNRSLLKDLKDLSRFDKNILDIDEIIRHKDENEEDFIETINYFSRKAVREYKDSNITKNELLNKYDNLINSLYEKQHITRIFNNLDEIKHYLNQNSVSDDYNDYATLFKNEYLNNNELKNSSKFKKYIIDNRLINIFGITTTSTITLTLLRKNDVDLFYDWPIDIVIIDEISKSSTPEILSKIVLAKKIIFAGDYKQLPPKCDLTIDVCQDLVQNDAFLNKFINKDQKNNNVFNESEDNNKEKAKKLFNWLKTLYKDSFFNKEVQELKKQPDKKLAPYQNLTIQHRFCENIMNIVNTFYDYDERLEMPSNPRKFPKYKMNFKYSNGSNKSCDDSVILIDSSSLNIQTKNYFETKYKIKNLKEESFDTYNWNNNLYSSTVNPYNCLIIANVIDNLYQQNNPNLKLNNIGIITMTRSQKSLIKNELKKINHEYTQIKVDTVDNFQGRENEIIILDFVRSHGQ